MPARALLLFFLLIPLGFMSKQANANEEDMELFEFLAMYDQNDEIFIDSEIDEKINETVAKQKDVTSLNESKSESDE